MGMADKTPGVTGWGGGLRFEKTLRGGSQPWLLRPLHRVETPIEVDFELALSGFRRAGCEHGLWSHNAWAGAPCALRLSLGSPGSTF